MYTVIVESLRRYTALSDYIGIIHFEKTISCIKDVSGKRFRSKIAGKDILIVFPSIPDNYDGSQFDLQNGDLVVPNNLFHGKVNWGMINNYPQCLFTVKAVLCYISATETEIHSIYQEFPKWKDKLMRLHIINTSDYMSPKQKLPALIQGGGVDDGLRIFEVVDRTKLQYVRNSRSTETIKLHFVATKESYSVDAVSMLFANAGAEKEIALTYELLINAYCSMERNDFRSAVILAGSAVERAILTRMKCEYSNTTDYERDSKKHRMLGRKFEWLSEKSISIPVVDYETAILDVRNDATHDGICPSYSATKDCLEKCKILIEEYHPQVLEQ